MKPHFLLIGAMKCGTTSMCGILEQHPGIFISRPKEPNFFSFERKYSRGWDWYQGLFTKAKPEQVSGEGSVSYSITGAYPQVVERVKRHLPEIKIIYMVRDPIQRIESEYRQRKRGGRKVGSDLKQTIAKYPLVEASSYWKQINAYRSFVPENKIHVIFFEDFIQDTKSEVA